MKDGLQPVGLAIAAVVAGLGTRQPRRQLKLKLSPRLAPPARAGKGAA